MAMWISIRDWSFLFLRISRRSNTIFPGTRPQNWVLNWAKNYFMTCAYLPPDLFPADFVTNRRRPLPIMGTSSVMAYTTLRAHETRPPYKIWHFLTNLPGTGLPTI